MIKESFRDELEKVMCGIVSNQKCKTYAIYCNPDHTHIFVGMHPTLSPSKLDLFLFDNEEFINPFGASVQP